MSSLGGTPMVMVWRKAVGAEALQTYKQWRDGAVGGQGGMGRGRGARGRAVVLLIHSVHHTATLTHPRPWQSAPRPPPALVMYGVGGRGQTPSLLRTGRPPRAGPPSSTVRLWPRCTVCPRSLLGQARGPPSYPGPEDPSEDAWWALGQVSAHGGHAGRKACTRLLPTAAP